MPPPAAGVTRIEGEDLIEKAFVKLGNVKPQGMSGFGPAWSGNRQLWWTGGQPGEVLT